jgi:hypothetical protein
MKIAKAYFIYTILFVWNIFSILGTINSSIAIGRITQLMVFIMMGLAVLTILLRKDILSNVTIRFLIIWLFYVSINTLLFAGSTQLGIMNTLIDVCWWGIIYILFYSIFINDVHNKYYKRLIKIYPYFYFLIYALIVYKMVFYVGSIINGTIKADDINAVYWILLLVPFAFLLDNKIIKYVILFLSFILVIISSKRGGTIAISLVLLFSIFTDTFKWENFLRNLLIGTILSVSLFSILEKTISMVDVNVFKRFEETEINEESRMYLYIETLKNFKSKDLTFILIGSGHRSSAIDRGSMTKTAHNDYLEVLYDYGILGIILYLYFNWKIIIRLKNLYKIGGKYFHAYFTAFIIFFIMSMVSQLIIYPTYFAYLSILWALTEAQINKTRKTGLNYLN